MVGTRTLCSFEHPDFNIANAMRVNLSGSNEMHVKKLRDFVAATTSRDGRIGYRLIPRSLSTEWISCKKIKHYYQLFSFPNLVPLL